ncbi:MAG: rhomboid family intramembrane serine protease [Balneola sp.]
MFTGEWTPIGGIFAPFLPLFPIESGLFYPWQLLSYMFLHGDLSHIIFNLLALWIFGQAIENLWGTKRFIIYYLLTGIGAAIFYQFVNMLEILALKNELLSMGYSPTDLEAYVKGGLFNQSWPAELKQFVRKSLIPTVGASGAVFGILLAFGMMFPNQYIILLFPPIPIKAKYFVGIYGAVELFSGLSRANSGVAHFAHLGGLIVGFILIKLWKIKKPYGN